MSRVCQRAAHTHWSQLPWPIPPPINCEIQNLSMVEWDVAMLEWDASMLEWKAGRVESAANPFESAANRDQLFRYSSYTRMSPGWHSNSLQMAASVEKLMVLSG
jgi:hypothetical protein